MKSPIEFAEELRAQAERLMPKPDQIYSIHSKIRSMTRTFDDDGPAMRDIRDFHIQSDVREIPVRLYIPKTAPEIDDEGETPEGPCLIYLHGGGFVTCDLDSHESLCLRIADAAGIRVLSVDYRLAPEFPFPAGPDDCEHVVKWALDGTGQAHGIAPDKIAIGGDSAGGNMSAYIAQKYRAQISGQILLYPVMQLADVHPPNPGLQDALQLGTIALNFILKHYVGDADVNDTRLSPLFEPDLKTLPQTFLLTCGLDPLRDEGRVYAENLQKSGVDVEFVHEKAMPHGYLNFARAFPVAKKTPLAVGAFLRKTFNLH